MEKRLLAFLWVSVAVVLGFTMLQRVILGPPAHQRAVAERDAADEGAKPADKRAELADKPMPAEEPVAPDERPADAKVDPQAPLRHVTLGSLDPRSGYNMLVTLTSEGGSLERIELNSPRYRELEPRGGYLGHLQLTDDPAGGCRVQVVGPGTPAARAKSDTFATPGLQGPQYRKDGTGAAEKVANGDRIISLDGTEVLGRADFEQRLAGTRPGQEIVIGVERASAQGDPQRGDFTVHLARHPLQLVRPELNSPDQSFLISLAELADHKVPLDRTELSQLPSLRRSSWRVRELPAGDEAFGPGIEFRFSLTSDELDKMGVAGAWDLVKRYRLARHVEGPDEMSAASGFRLRMEIELVNRGTSAQRIAYQLDGPSGLTDEGWWYSYKVHPRRFAAAGARDVIWRAVDGRHELFLCPEITQYAKKNPKSPDKSLIDAAKAPVTLQYVGSDAQYFLVAMLPDPAPASEDPLAAAAPYQFREARAHVIGTPDPRLAKRTNVTFRLVSEPCEVAADDALRHRFTIFAGPKDPRVLHPLGLEESIVFGWFKVVARPMVTLLHGLYRISGNVSFGIAIILLTVMVRGLMFPFGRQMAMNAQKMQELAPEMKAIAEKYADDLQKRGEAQRELFRKHNYNPFGGCVVMLFQLPVFVGLYRALSVDIELRQAPLIPGMSWCSNLAGPDMLLYWESALPAFLSSRSGWLGPYLNILPILSIVLMLIHQKMFTPPPQDEQQKSQQAIMKYMMIFFGVMFHKIAAGLCIYFIASSFWGLAERRLLPKSKPAGAGSAMTRPLVTASSNGSKSAEHRRKAKRKGRK